MDKMDNLILFLDINKRITSGEILTNFDKWHLSIESEGDTLAHHAAYHNVLPINFNQWDLVDRKGWSVAHQLAFYHNLPEGFDQWHLRSKSNVTIASIVIKKKQLPENFTDWESIVRDEKDDKSMLLMAILYENLPNKWSEWGRMVENPEYKTSANQLDKITVAECVLKHGNLPVKDKLVDELIQLEQVLNQLEYHNVTLCEISESILDNYFNRIIVRINELNLDDLLLIVPEKEIMMMNYIEDIVNRFNNIVDDEDAKDCFQSLDYAIDCKKSMVKIALFEDNSSLNNKEYVSDFTRSL